jgi:DNA-binding beta-propeller fold protein YncE
MPRRLSVLVVLAGVLGIPVAAAAAPPPAGMLVQLAAPAACYSTTAGGGCSVYGGGFFITGDQAIAASDDGHDLYVGGSNGGGVAFSLGAGGALTQVAPASFGGGTALATSGAGVFLSIRQTGSDNGDVVAFKRAADGSATFANAVTDSCPAGTAHCANNNGLFEVTGVAVSPDGAHVYAASHFGGGGTTGGALTAFSRNPTTQAVTELQCVPEATSTSGLCNSGATDGLGGADSVVVSPDGKFVYATGNFDNAVIGFNVVQSGPNAGKLGSSVNCLWAGATTSDCVQTPGTGAPEGIAISPDGRDVYVASFGGGVTALHRDTLSGVLSLNHCITETGSGGCTADPSYVTGARDVAVSPDGRYVYVSGGGALLGFVIAYARDGSTGAISRIGCLTNLAAPGCTTAAGLANAGSLALTPDGGHAYVTSFQGGDGSGAVAAFRVQSAPSCTDAGVQATAGTGVSIPLACTDAAGDAITRSIVSGPAKGTLGAIDQGAATVLYTPLASASGGDALTFAAGDGTNSSAPATVAISIAARAMPDRVRPSSRIQGLSRHVKAKDLKGFHGTAKDDRRLKRVDIALTRLAGGAKIASATCASLTGKGTFKGLKVRHRRCAVSGFLAAKGTATWSFKLKHRLAPGTYVLTSRALDTSGNHESGFSTRRGDRVVFTVS